MTHPAHRAPAVPIATDVFTASGEPVAITMPCLNCHRVKPLSAFGLRRLGGKLRSISWCKACRAGGTRESP